MFTIDEIRLLAKCERMMDAGEIPFVMLDGMRVSVNRDVMVELGLEQGQTITPTIHIAILQAKIAQCDAAIAMQRIQDERKSDDPR